MYIKKGHNRSNKRIGTYRIGCSCVYFFYFLNLTSIPHGVATGYRAVTNYLLSLPITRTYAQKGQNQAPSYMPVDITDRTCYQGRGSRGEWAASRVGRETARVREAVFERLGLYGWSVGVYQWEKWKTTSWRSSSCPGVKLGVYSVVATIVRDPNPIQ